MAQPLVCLESCHACPSFRKSVTSVLVYDIFQWPKEMNAPWIGTPLCRLSRTFRQARNWTFLGQGVCKNHGLYGVFKRHWLEPSESSVERSGQKCPRQVNKIPKTPYISREREGSITQYNQVLKMTKTSENEMSEFRTTALGWPVSCSNSSNNSNNSNNSSNNSNNSNNSSNSSNNSNNSSSSSNSSSNNNNSNNSSSSPKSEPVYQVLFALYHLSPVSLAHLL